MWGSFAKGYFKIKETQSIESDLIQQETERESGGWSIGETMNGHFGVAFTNVLKLVVQSDGGVWGASNGGGFFEKRAEADPEKDAILPLSGKVLKTGSSINMGNWTLGVS